MSTFIPFELEKWQSDYEHAVAFNLADSGVHGLTIEELLVDAPARERLLKLSLNYPATNGTPRLRELIAGLYGARPEDVLVTVGAAEATNVVIDALVSPSDDVLAMEPGYRLLWGRVQNLRATLVPFRLKPGQQWTLDLEELRSLATPRTRLIAVTNPNNPTGKILSEAEMEEVVGIASRCGAWILSDEVYRGTERLTDRETPTFFGRYDRVICLGSLSKAYGLPGLRLGWVVAPPEVMPAIWRRHEYAVISAGALDMLLAERALSEPTRSGILARSRRYIREGYSRMGEWIQKHSAVLSVIPPEATALVFVKYNLELSSFALADAFRQRADVLVAPGECFGVDRYFRVNHGVTANNLDQALARIGTVLQELSRGTIDRETSCHP